MACGLRSRVRTRILTGSLLHLIHNRRTVGFIGVQSDGRHVGVRFVGLKVVWGRKMKRGRGEDRNARWVGLKYTVREGHLVRSERTGNRRV